MTDDLRVIQFATGDQWDAWLKKNGQSADGVWLKVAKQGADSVTVRYPEALEIALCYGWIDGQKRKFDDLFWLQRFTRRRARSKWSQVNRDKALQLIAAGRMKPSGLREVEGAQADGRWAAAYAPQSAREVPADLQAALDANPRAGAFFSGLTSQNRYAILYRIGDAKRPETRARRIEQFVAMLNDHKTLHPA